MDGRLHEAILRKDIEYGHVALRVCNMLNPKEILALYDLPCNDGQYIEDSRVLLEICRAATMGMNFHTEWFTEDRPAMEVAAEAVFTTIRQYAFNGVQTVDNLMACVVWELAGRMNIDPADRAAYGMAAKACLATEIPSIEKGSEQFTFLMQQASSFIAENMPYEMAQHELNELAGLLFHGISVADFQAQETSRNEKATAEEFQRGIHILDTSAESMAEMLGIDETEVQALMNYEISFG
jgi:hypothetical protein